MCFLLDVMFSYFSFFFSCYGGHRDLHSFPTRRSSDLSRPGPRLTDGVELLAHILHPERVLLPPAPGQALVVETAGVRRSEEHTSELQSLRHLVCRLLLEKKKAKKTPMNNTSDTTNGDN